ncbi:MAG: cytochrome P450 [Actinomycetota bacterium]|nr:cytochrome P450 [Actinomycetota bacterium]
MSLKEMRADPLGFLQRTFADFGDFTRHHTEESEVFLVNRPELARSVLRERRRQFIKAGTPDERMLTPLLGRGLLTSDGDVWKRQRRLAQPAFERHHIENLDELMSAATLDLLRRWEPAIADGRALRVDHDLTGLALGIVARALLGADMSGIGPKFGEAVDTVNRFMGHYEPLEDSSSGAAARAEFARALSFLDRIVRLLIDGRRAGGQDRDDLLGRLLTAGGQGPDGEPPFTARELRDQVLTMLMAGHETTAKTLTWTLYLLDAHRDVAERLRREVRSVLGERLPTAAELPQLDLCRRVIQEAMRLYPPVWLMSRLCVLDTELGGYAIPAGALVCVSPYMLHRHPGHWERPERFEPERFTDQAAQARHPFSYLPFSEGPRKCIGHAFAMTEAQIALAMIVRRADLRLVPGHPVEPEALVTLRPREGMLMTLSPAA